MAIEWNIDSGARVDAGMLASHVAADLTSLLAVPLAVSLFSDWPPRSDAVLDSGVVFQSCGDGFSCWLGANVGEDWWGVEIDLAIYEDGSGGSEFFGSVAAIRSAESVVLGIVTAISWHRMCGGTLSGVGLGGGRLTVDESAKLAGQLLIPGGGSVEQFVSMTVRRLGCGVLVEP